MLTTPETRIMADRPPATATIKVDPELLRKAKQTAALRDQKLQDYIDDLLRGPVERDHAKELKKIRNTDKDGNS